MRGGRVGHRVLGHLAPAVRPGHHPGGPVLGGEVVQQPDGVGDLVVARRHRARPVDVQALVTLAGPRAAPVEREDLLGLPPQHVRDGRELARVVPAQVEQRVLVDQVGQSVRALLPVRFQAGLVALGLDQLVEALHQRPHRGRVDQVGQGQVTLLVEQGPVGVGQQRGAGPERAEDPQHLLVSHHSIVNCQRFERKIETPACPGGGQGVEPRAPRAAATLSSGQSIQFSPVKRKRFELCSTGGVPETFALSDYGIKATCNSGSSCTN